MSGHIQGDVKESYEELQAMIAETGCIRAKAPDPRLDTRVLTMEDMTKVSMIGEPVWNSSTKKWMLLIDSANDGTWVELINNAGGHEKMNAHDIQNNRFYRTVQKEGD
ncbi:MAG: hypothetical protein J6W04_02065 [Bacteroidales bacterium]|nr:hypothetical protein [Bacteroidales bacterium]